MKLVELNMKTRIEPANIMYFEADENYTIIHYSTNRIEVIAITLKKIEHKLAEHMFFRVHRSYLINLDYVLKKQSRFEVQMKDFRSLTVARRKASSFNKAIKQKATYKRT